LGIKINIYISKALILILYKLTNIKTVKHFFSKKYLADEFIFMN